MSYHLHTKSIHFLPHEAVVPMTAQSPREQAAADHALDATLRSVPLPEGMLARLEKFVGALPDENADQADWLSC